MLRAYTHADLPPLLQQASQLLIRSPYLDFSSESIIKGDGLKAAQEQKVGFFDQVNLDEALEIYSIVRSLRPSNTMEIGFCCGGSGLAILKALEDNAVGLHHAIDPYQSSYARNLGIINVSASNLDHRLRFFEAFPEDCFQQWPTVEFAFIDASHLFDLSMLDFVLVDKRLSIGGVVGFHDLWMPALQKLVRFILRNRGYIPFPASVKLPVSLSLFSKLSRLGRKALESSPKADRIFSHELLSPFHSSGFGNMVFLQKVSNDNRDFRVYRDF